MSTHDDDRDHAAADQLRRLREETEALARALPGTMRRLSVKSGDHKVEVEWEARPAAGGAAAAPAGAAAAQPEAQAAEEPGGHPIAAPLVGTFYASPEPGADPFVTVGGPVEAGQDVCIVEAMKIMNRVQSDVTGTVREVLVNDGEIVEYGQAIMIIDTGQGGQDDDA